MNCPIIPYQIFPLGDTALTIYFGNTIDEEINREVIARFSQLQQQPITGMIEIVPSYSSLTIYYNVCEIRKHVRSDKTVFEWIKEQVTERMKYTVEEKLINKRLLKIPVCYDSELGTDIQQLAATKNMSIEEVIQIHTSKNYNVYMLGFLPGFAYMGEVDDRIIMPRKPQPQNVIAGSVGIAGKQTGIYPLTSPGGWQIIGRTPLKLFVAQKEEPTLLKAGDIVQFYSITKNEFEKIILQHMN
ncbi:MAG: 5-oxoprolinase subunit PxpB [Chitinophagaceae bacterium]